MKMEISRIYGKNKARSDARLSAMAGMLSG